MCRETLHSDEFEEENWGTESFASEGNRGVCRESLYSDEIEEENGDKAMHEFGGEVRASHGGARTDGTASETKTLHMCHPHAHVALSFAGQRG